MVPIEEPIDHVQIGDMDGDGRQDVVVDTGSELRVHYFASGASLDQTVSISVEQPTPALGDFNGDGKMDVAYSLSNAAAVAVRLGSADRSLPAVPFPLSLSNGKYDLGLKSADSIIAIHEAPVDPKAYSLRELLRMQESTITTFTGPAVAKDPGSIAQFVTIAPDAGWADLPSQPASGGPVDVPTGKLVKGSPCPQFVFPHAKANQIQVYQPCVALPGPLPNSPPTVVWNTPGTSYYVAPSIVKVPLNVQITGSAYIVDVDGDGDADVAAFANIKDPLLGTTAGIVVAYGDGAGKFGSSPTLTSDGLAKPYYCFSEIDLGMQVPPEVSACKTEQPFALADFDGDGVLDVVNGCGVFLGSTTKSSKCGVYGAMVPAVSSRTGLAAAPWTTARVVDLNLDGKVNLVAGSCASSFVTYLENAGQGVFNPYTIPAAGGVDQIAVGDFDGDLVPDVAFSQRVSPLACMDPNHPDAPIKQSIGVAFGAYLGGPSDPISLTGSTTPLSTIKQLLPSYLVSPAGSYDAIDNLVTVTDAGENAPESILSTFAGNTDRGEIIAPYFLVDPSDGLGDVPWLLAMGRFGSRTGGAGVAVLSSERGMSVLAHEAEVWLLAAQQNSTLSMQSFQSYPQVGDPASYANPDGQRGAWVSAVDLGDALGDTLVAVAFDNDAAAFSGKTLILTLTAEPSAVPTQDQTITGYFSGPIVVSDVDGDGNKDLVVHSSSVVAVIWNKGAPKLGAPSLTTVPSVCDDYPVNLVAATALRTAPTAERQILAVDDRSNAYLLTQDPPQSSGPPTFTVTCFNGSLQLGPASGNVLLAAGDVDGDGVDDVVVGSPGAVQVFRGAPVNQ